jgi:hypothetical protein
MNARLDRVLWVSAWVITGAAMVVLVMQWGFKSPTSLWWVVWPPLWLYQLARNRLLRIRLNNIAFLDQRASTFR